MFTVLLTSLLVATPLPQAPFDISVTSELKECAGASVGAILGANLDGCILYDTAKRETKLEVNLCGGVYVNLTAKELGIGFDVNISKTLCVIKLSMKLNDNSLDEFKKRLKEDAAFKKAIQAELFKQLKPKLLEFSDQELRQMGLKRIEVKESTKATIKQPVDRTDKSTEIKKQIKELRDRKPTPGVG